jgi:altronate hydrolase
LKKALRWSRKCCRGQRCEARTLQRAHITIGLQCGGSDGYSGISANPALGAAVDLLVAHGGTAILSETPEIYGAEHLLTRRAVKTRSGRKAHLAHQVVGGLHPRNDGEMNNNPSPGNKAGGLTTILEKSLGAVAKGGTTNLEAVYEYAEPVTATASSTWTRRATTRSAPPARWPAAPT